MKPNWDAKRLSLIALLLVIAILAVEGSLALLRRRDVMAAIRVESLLPTPTATPPGQQPTATPEGTTTPDPQITALLMSDDGRVLVDVRWAYNIGPRFPQTYIRAMAIDQNQRVVASDGLVINCGSATLTCDGNQRLTLRYGARAAEFEATTSPGTPPALPTPTSAEVRWPAGEYQVLVTRAYQGFAEVQVSRQMLFVSALP